MLGELDSNNAPLLTAHVDEERGVFPNSTLDEDSEAKKVESLSERCCGVWKLCYFLVCCSCSLCCGTLFAAGPWMLAFIEITGVFLVYYLGVRPSFDHHTESVRQAIDSFVDHALSFRDRVEDILAFAVVRGIVVSLAYGLGTGNRHHRPYLHASYVFLVLSLIFIVLKAYYFNWQIYVDRDTAKYVVVMMVINLGCSFLHIPTARHVHIAARQRYTFGIPQGFGFPGEGGEGEDEAWLLTATAPDGIKLMMRNDDQEDVLPEELTDEDSKFCIIKPSNLKIHYKECFPSKGVRDPLTGIVLVHGFAGGTFSWRKIMTQLAEQCASRVIAMDCVGWGLSSRPGREECKKENYYETGAQAKLLLRFCSQLGLREVVFVSQGSGALFAILATTITVRLRMASSSSVLLDNGRFSKLRKFKHHLEELHSSWRQDDRIVMQQMAEEGTSSACLEGQNNLLATPKVIGLVLLHPLLESNPVARFTRPLSKTRLGRDILRPLLRVAVGQVINHRLWYNESKLTEEVVDLYQKPLHVQGWDYALIQRCNQAPRQAIYGEDEFLESASDVLAAIPTLIITGLADKVVTPQQATALTTYFKQSQRVDLSNCGHFAIEEVPDVLLEFVVPFLRRGFRS